MMQCNASTAGDVKRVLHLHGLTAAAAGQAEPPPRLVHCLKGVGTKQAQIVINRNLNLSRHSS